MLLHIGAGPQKDFLNKSCAAYQFSLVSHILNWIFSTWKFLIASTRLDKLEVREKRPRLLPIFISMPKESTTRYAWSKVTERRESYNNQDRSVDQAADREERRVGLIPEKKWKEV